LGGSTPRKRRRVVHTVADHPHELPLVLEFLGFLVFVFREDLREHRVDAQFVDVGDRLFAEAE
jgi:hypothetical protein